MRAQESSPQERLTLRRSEKNAKSGLWEYFLQEAVKVSLTDKTKEPEFRRYVNEGGVRIKKLPHSEDK